MCLIIFGYMKYDSLTGVLIDTGELVLVTHADKVGRGG